MSGSARILTTCQATLRVEARGYWFTAGGQKGSFGYFPHLRDADNLPVYPDTQIHGDLKMAARWLAGLGLVKKELVDALFGTGGGDEKKKSSRSSRLFPGDLCLCADSTDEWKQDRFEIKTRIRINDETRTVDEHFLVDLEMARLDDLVLEAPLYLLADDNQLQTATELLQEAVQLLSGFGAFRSRGFGRGKITLSKFEPLGGKGNGSDSFHPGKWYYYSITALTNVRNKPVDPGSAQVIETSTAIQPEQLKGWLARAYQQAHGNWPDPVSMAAVRFSPLYPSPAEDTLAWPPPMSTLKDKEGNIKDTWGEKLDEKEQQENFFSGKAKPLTGHTVTEDADIWPIGCQARMRNRMKDDSFITDENGLFVQEFLSAGTIFTGSIEITEKNTFTDRITALLNSSVPVINGALFTSTPGKQCQKRYGAANDKPELMASSRPYQPDLRISKNSITISTRRGYNFVCRRPRRPRVVVTPGSTLLHRAESGDAPWKGFNKVIKSPPKSKDIQPGSRAKKQYLIPLSGVGISRAQAGILRTMLHPELTEAFLDNVLQDRINKYEGRSRDAQLRKLLTDIQQILADKQDGGLKIMRQAVREVIEQLALARWEDKNKEHFSADKKPENNHEHH